MSTIYKLEAIEDYIFCGLYYRYKHELDLPYKRNAMASADWTAWASI